jgi:hypothetical protein
VSWLTQDVVDAVCRHMNCDHAADIAVMVGRPGVAAQVVDLDESALYVEAETERIALPWPGPLKSRTDIRTYVVEMHTRALEGEK